MAKPIRFGVTEVFAGSAREWTETALKVEDLGYSTLQVVDHLIPQFAPLVALAAAAPVTSTLRLGTQVLSNDYRHPSILAKELATLDVLSDGRLEVGIGAGWMLSDYQQAGITFDRPGRRIDRLEETLAILKAYAGEAPVSFDGEHYTITGHFTLPRPVQQPHPPILIGGGAKRMLRLAGREADIVSINYDLSSNAVEPPDTPRAAGVVSAQAHSTGTSAAMDQKIAWIKEGAGDRFDDLELNISAFITRVTDRQEETADDLGAEIGVSGKELLESPFVLIGSTGWIIDAIIERRERWGLSYWTFPTPIIPDAFKVLAPIVERLAGT